MVYLLCVYLCLYFVPSCLQLVLCYSDDYTEDRWKFIHTNSCLFELPFLKGFLTCGFKFAKTVCATCPRAHKNIGYFLYWFEVNIEYAKIHLQKSET